MRPIKFRQLAHGFWHYWGYLDDGFFGVVTPVIPSDQFTGLYDRNNVEIYEGDIITWEDNFKNKVSLVVVWDEAFCRFKAVRGLLERTFAKIDSVRMEVIGNITENSILLEKKP